MISKLKLSVSTFRAAGLEAKWGKLHSGRPAIFVRNPKSELAHQRDKWWLLTGSMFDSMQNEGVVEAFDRHTILGDVFAIPA
jgi:hypothetical protein